MKKGNGYIDKIKIDGKQHYVFHKTPIYWLISKYDTKKLMYSVLVSELKLTAKQKNEQSRIVANGIIEYLSEKTND